MRRLVITGAVTGAVLAAVPVIQTRVILAVTEPNPAPGYVDVAYRDSLRTVRLDVDRTVAAVGQPRIVPGAAYRYAFRVTNTGGKPVRHLAVRSDQDAEPGRGSGGTVRYVSSPECARAGPGSIGPVDCVFDVIPPGVTRRVTVEAVTSAAHRPGDPLIIKTYLGRFVPAPDGAATFDIMGDYARTSATFAANSG